MLGLAEYRNMSVKDTALVGIFEPWFDTFDESGVVLCDIFKRVLVYFVIFWRGFCYTFWLIKYIPLTMQV